LFCLHCNKKYLYREQKKKTISAALVRIFTGIDTLKFTVKRHFIDTIKSEGHN